MVGGTIVRSAPRKRKSGGFGGFFQLLASLAVLAGLLGGAGYVYARHVYTEAGPTTPDGKPRYVVIDPGAAAPAIAKSLRQAGAIKDETQFRMAAKAAELVWKPSPPAGATAKSGDGKLVMKAGEFAVPSGASLEQVISALSYGKPIQYTVVVPEGLTSAQIVGLLNRGQWAQWKPPGQAAEAAPRMLQLAGRVEDIPEEGTLLPGDYQVQRGETVEGLIKRMSKAQDDLFAQLWDKRRADLPFTSRREAVNLASIVEKETGVPEERPLVAAAFITRLRSNIRLQSDVTSLYGRDRGENAGRAMTAEELRVATPYSTYDNDGLPPTPICNPGRQAIEAVLNPPESKAIYFVADGVTGGHKFAETLAEHQKNVASLARLKAGERAAANLQKKLDAANASKTPPATPAVAPTTAPAAAPSAPPALKPAAATSPKPAASPTPAQSQSPAAKPETAAPTPAASPTAPSRAP